MSSKHKKHESLNQQGTSQVLCLLLSIGLRNVSIDFLAWNSLFVFIENFEQSITHDTKSANNNGKQDNC